MVDAPSSVPRRVWLEVASHFGVNGVDAAQAAALHALGFSWERRRGGSHVSASCDDGDEGEVVVVVRGRGGGGAGGGGGGGAATATHPEHTGICNVRGEAGRARDGSGRTGIDDRDLSPSPPVPEMFSSPATATAMGRMRRRQTDADGRYAVATTPRASSHPGDDDRCGAGATTGKVAAGTCIDLVSPPIGNLRSRPAVAVAARGSPLLSMSSLEMSRRDASRDASSSENFHKIGSFIRNRRDIYEDILLYCSADVDLLHAQIREEGGISVSRPALAAYLEAQGVRTEFTSTREKKHAKTDS